MDRWASIMVSMSEHGPVETPAPIGSGLMARLKKARVLSALTWLALMALALWPVGLWMGRRMIDGSDDPLGGLALLALGGWVVWQRRRFWRTPRPWHLSAAVAGAVLATTLHHLHWPDLAVALVALLSLAACLLAWLPGRVAQAPVWGLAVLSLPVLASLQFYAGYPLRVVTAELSGLLLRIGHTVERAGSSLWVDGQLVIVDAPCSGVQMVWLGYFTACAVALVCGRRDRTFMLRLPVVGLLVLTGNVVRNTVLVAAQAADAPLTGWMHDVVGLMVLGLVFGGIAWIIGMAESSGQTRSRRSLASSRIHPAFHRYLGAAGGFILVACALSHGMVGGSLDENSQTRRPDAAADSALASEWPSHWRGAPLRPLALSEVEQRFASQFPGRLTRMTDGHQVLVLRTVTRPTRMLHPAADCYRGLGYQITRERLELQDNAQPWRCFEARRAGRAVRVCERISDAAGQSYADTSAWYWGAVWRRTQGPWTAVTVATPLGEP